jgi:nitroreductase
MPEAPFDVDVFDHILSTTRAVRRRLDLSRPVEPDVIRECVRLSQQTPSGQDAQGWRWVVVTDEDKRAALGEIYGRALPTLRDLEQSHAADPKAHRMYQAVVWLAEHMGQVPCLVIPCVIGRPPEKFEPVLYATLYGSIVPAVWSFQLALRSRGLGSCYTTLTLGYEPEVRELLGIPEDVLQVAMLPVAYTVGTDFKVATRPDPDQAAEALGYDHILTFDHVRPSASCSSTRAAA